METNEEAAKEELVKKDENGGITEAAVWDALRLVIDPELHFNIVDLGLVYEVKPKGEDVDVAMTLTSPGCPFGPMLMHSVKEVVGDIGAKEVNIDVVWEPPWTPEKMTDEIKLELGFDL